MPTPRNSFVIFSRIFNITNLLDLHWNAFVTKPNPIDTTERSESDDILLQSFILREPTIKVLVAKIILFTFQVYTHYAQSIFLDYRRLNPSFIFCPKERRRSRPNTHLLMLINYIDNVTKSTSIFLIQCYVYTNLEIVK